MQHSIALVTGAPPPGSLTPLALDAPASDQSAHARLVKRGPRVRFILLNPGMVPGKKRVFTAGGVEAAQA